MWNILITVMRQEIDLLLINDLLFKLYSFKYLVYLLYADLNNKSSYLFIFA